MKRFHIHRVFHEPSAVHQRPNEPHFPSSEKLNIIRTSSKAARVHERVHSAHDQVWKLRILHRQKHVVIQQAPAREMNE